MLDNRQFGELKANFPSDQKDNTNNNSKYGVNWTMFAILNLQFTKTTEIICESLNDVIYALSLSQIIPQNYTHNCCKAYTFHKHKYNRACVIM